MTNKQTPAITKKHSPCQRCTRSTDGRCWQHPLLVAQLLRGDPSSKDAEVIATGNGKPPTATFHSPVQAEPGPHWLVFKHYGGKTRREPVAQATNIEEGTIITGVTLP